MTRGNLFVIQYLPYVMNLNLKSNQHGIHVMCNKVKSKGWFSRDYRRAGHPRLTMKKKFRELAWVKKQNERKLDGTRKWRVPPVRLRSANIYYNNFSSKLDISR